jgi:integrase
VARQPFPLEDVVRPLLPEGLYDGEPKALGVAEQVYSAEALDDLEQARLSLRPEEMTYDENGHVVLRRPDPADPNIREVDRQRLIREAHERAVLAFVYQYILDRGTLPPELEGQIPPAQLAALKALRGDQAVADRTVDAQAAAWLKDQELRVAAKEISPGGYDNKKRWLGKFLDFVGRTADVATITDGLLEAFDTHCLHRRAAHAEGKEGGWSDYAVRDVRAVAREWLCWLADKNVIPRPAWVMRKGRKFRLTPRSIKPWTVEEYRAVLNATNRDQVKLIFLLGANAGMTQKDCTDLRPDEVDWKAGYVERRRSKTRHVKNAPVVRYKLWPATLDLLLRCYGGGDRVITTSRGTPYVREGMKAGRRDRCDSFWSHFQLVKRRVQRAGLPDFNGSPKGVRKMAATILGSHPAHSRFVGHFLGHAPQSVADRHYNRLDQAAFDEAVTWVGRQLGMVPAAEASC